MISQLDKKEKLAFLKKLGKTSQTELKNAIVQAICDGKTFPKNLEEQFLKSLPQTYQDHKTNKDMEPHLKKAIEGAVSDEFIIECKKLLKNQDLWMTDLITYLSKNLVIPLKSSLIVQVGIKDGKIYWRAKKENDILYDREKSKNRASFEFTDENSIEMTWEQFRQFKNTGKRYGTAKITCKNFIEHFSEGKQIQAKAVWDELKEKKFLDDKNRLSATWRMTSGESITLNTITDSKWIISKDQLTEILKKLKNANSKGITKNDFLKECKKQLKMNNTERYEAIFDALVDKKVLCATRNGKKYNIISLVYKEADILSPVQMTYKEIAEALNTISNDESRSAESIANIAKTIYRPERSLKSWTKNKDDNGGTVENLAPKSSEHCAKLWDVSLYNDLDKHRNSDDQKKENKKILNYDHVPSSDSLHRFVDLQVVPLKGEVKKLEDEEKVIKKQIDNSKKKPSKKLTNKLEDIHHRKTEEKNNLKKEISMYGDEDRWYTVAIPEALHRQGETFMQSSKAQAENLGEPFINEFECYVNLLTTRFKDFNLDDKKCVFFLIAAFRHLYRLQVKEPENTVHFGKAPYDFFQSKVNREKLDRLIISETKKIMAIMG